jgi:predicted dehydrogenase
MACHGHEHWHPGPEFYYKAGGGPMFDMGPYYLTALVSLLGPVKRVSGSAKKSFNTRTITSKPLEGAVISVDVPTHIAGVMDFANGAVGTIITSFDVYSHTLPWMEIYGSAGSLRVPDPNTFGGPVYVSRFMEETWKEMPLEKNYADNSRGLGITDMAEAVEEKRSHRASGEMAFHVLDLMHGFHDASGTGKYYEVASSCERPAPL